MYTRLHTCTGFAISDKNNDADPGLAVGLGIVVAIVLLGAVFAAWLLIRKRTKKFTDAGQQQYAAVKKTDTTFAAAVDISEEISAVAESDNDPNPTDDAPMEADTSLMTVDTATNRADIADF